jgi:pimeloyl-ACP methyl ester carboxylesterase
VTAGSLRATSRSGVAYVRRGEGSPVVLVHGWCLNRHMWMYLEEGLVAEHDVTTLDLAGFGESDGLAGPYRLDRYARDLGDLLDELELNHATVVGFAFGAAVAMVLGAAGHDRLGRVVLIGIPSAAFAAYDRMPAAMRRDWPLFAERSADAICGRPPSAATRAWLTAMFASTSLPVAIETCAVLGEFDPIAVASDVHVPALFIHGGDDQIVPPDVSATCAARMANARVEVVPECGHLVVLDQKEQLADLVAAFVAEASSGVTR